MSTDEPVERTRRTVPAGAFVVALMVAAALGVLAVVALASAGDDGDGSSVLTGGRGEREVRLAAGRFTEQFLTYDGDDFDAWKAEVLELSTGGFAKEFEEAERGLRVFFEEGARDAVAQVSEVFVGQEERGSVQVVVVYDREVRGDGDYTESDRYLQLAMLRIDGRWLVDNVIDIATASDLGAPTTTAIPPDPASDPTSDPTSGTTAPGPQPEG